MGNGKFVAPRQVGDLKLMVCDKDMNELGPGTVRNLHVIPGSPFHLLAGNKLLLEGYSMTGNIKDGLISLKIIEDWCST